MASTAKQKLSRARSEVREYKAECEMLEAQHQGRLRRSIGSVIQNGTGYAGTRGVMELQKAGMWTAGGFPFDVVISALGQLAGDLRFLGPVSDVTRETLGGHTTGRLGGMATLHTLGVRYVNGQFVNAAGDPLPPKPE